MALRQSVLAWVALALTILIWGSYLVSTRAAMTQNLSAYDVGFLRSVPASVAMIPFILKRGLKPKGASWIDVGIIGGLGGTLFTILLANGFRYAPVVNGGLFTPSMLPVFVAILTIGFVGHSYRHMQFLGIALILIGALTVGGFEAISNAQSGTWRGHLLFLTASCCWAAYTVRFNWASLDPIDGAILLLAWSAIAFTICLLAFGTSLILLPASVLTVQLFQGFMAGFVANFTYLYAIRALGSSVAAAAAALVPTVGAIGGWIFLEEPITIVKWGGVSIIAAGVVIASGVLSGNLNRR
jgi:drug/metabolite transporter (DMT)-like permease